MGNNGALQILRGTREAIVDNSTPTEKSLLAGQLLYNITDNTLSIGGEKTYNSDNKLEYSNSIINKLPIASSEIKGYVKDIQGNCIFVKTPAAGVNEASYHIKYVDGKGLEIKNDIISAGQVISGGTTYGSHSFAWGSGAVAGKENPQVGEANTSAIALGMNVKAEGASSFVVGRNNIGGNNNVFIAGEGNVSNAANQFIIGRYAKINANTIFAIGDGTGTEDTNRSTILDLTSDKKLSLKADIEFKDKTNEKDNTAKIEFDADNNCLKFIFN